MPTLASFPAFAIRPEELPMNALPRIPLPLPPPPWRTQPAPVTDPLAWIGYEAALPWIRVAPALLSRAPTPPLG